MQSSSVTAWAHFFTKKKKRERINPNYYIWKRESYSADGFAVDKPTDTVLLEEKKNWTMTTDKFKRTR